MRIFGSRKSPKGTAARDRAGAAAAKAVEAFEPVDLAVTEEMPVLQAPDVVESQTGAADEGDSDVFVCRSRRTSSPPPDLGTEAAVTLFVYGWENVEPGPLSWVFPSLRAALDAVKTMRNAIEWCVVAGRDWSDVDAARQSGVVLIEQNA